MTPAEAARLAVAALKQKQRELSGLRRYLAGYRDSQTVAAHRAYNQLHAAIATLQAIAEGDLILTLKET